MEAENLKSQKESVDNVVHSLHPSFPEEGQVPEPSLNDDEETDTEDVDEDTEEDTEEENDSNNNDLEEGTSGPDVSVDSASEAAKRQSCLPGRGGRRRGRGGRWNRSRLMSGGIKRKNVTDPDLDDEATDIEDNEEFDDEEEPFEWPTEVAIRDRPLPSISNEHRDLIIRYKEKDIISSDKVYQLMMSADFNHFYHEVKDCWVEHNAIILERTLQVIKEGDRILVFPLNIYFCVCLALYVGEKGGVICFGHFGNTNSLRKAGIEWLLDDYRIRFTNITKELFFGKPDYVSFLDEGFPRGAPYDAIIMTDQPLSDAVFQQLKPGGFIFRPDLNVNEMFLKGDVPEDLFEPTEAESNAENVPLPPDSLEFKDETTTDSSRS